MEITANISTQYFLHDNDNHNRQAALSFDYSSDEIKMSTDNCINTMDADALSPNFNCQWPLLLTWFNFNPSMDM